MARETQTPSFSEISFSNYTSLLPSMTEDGYTSSSALDGGEQSEGHQLNVPFHGRPSFQSLDSVEETESTNGHVTSISSQPRSSSDSRSKSPLPQPWRDTAPSSLSDRRENLPSLVEPSFDEHVLRALCELDVSDILFLCFDILHKPFYSDFFIVFCQCGVPLLLDRIKQSSVSCRVCPPYQLNSSYFFPTFNFQEASVFFKKRAIIEDEYGKQLQKLARSTSEVYALNDGKAGYAAF